MLSNCCLLHLNKCLLGWNFKRFPKYRYKNGTTIAEKSYFNIQASSRKTCQKLSRFSWWKPCRYSPSPGFAENWGGYEYTRDPRTVLPPSVFNNYPTELLKEVARGITCPFLFIRGRHSVAPVSLEPKELHKEFFEIYNNANQDFRCVDVDGKHHVHLTNPDIVASHISVFLSTETREK